MWVERYNRIPFVDGGRDFDGCDCWGLVRLVFLKEKGIEINGYLGIPCDSPDVVERIGQDCALPPWQTVVASGHERAFDVAVMRGHMKTPDGLIQGPFHVGLVYRPGGVFHIRRGKAAICESLGSRTIQRRLISIHRHEALV